MNKPIILTLMTCFAIMSCETKKEESITKTNEITKDTTNNIKKDSLHTTTSNIRNSKKTTTDWVGTYKGILPCADCAGIKTSVTLNKDESIKVVSEYIKRNTKLEDEGHFKWTADNNAFVFRYKR